MSTFELAIVTILQHEGGFINNPNDKGGATNFGISQRYLSHLLNREVTTEEIKTLSKEKAMQIYKKHWWDQYSYGAIMSQAIATKVFDLAINIGPYYAHRLLQHACWKTQGRKLPELIDDGIIGPITINVVNNINPESLLSAIKSEATEFYRSLHKPAFEKGWIKRANDEYKKEHSWK